jgi:hypothetical protein
MTLEYTLGQIGYRNFGDLESNARIFIMDGELAPREQSVHLHTFANLCLSLVYTTQVCAWAC